MKTPKEIKERISLIDDKIFHLENLMTKDDLKRRTTYNNIIVGMVQERNALKWVLKCL